MVWGIMIQGMKPEKGRDVILILCLSLCVCLLSEKTAPLWQVGPVAQDCF